MSIQMSKHALQKLFTPLSILLIIAAIPIFADDTIISIATRVLIFGLASVGLGIIVGYCGLVSFGHAAYFGVGAYTVLAFSLAGFTEAFVVWPAAGLAGAIVALIFGTLALRTRGPYFIMLTLALAQMLFFLLPALPGLGGDDGLPIYTRNKLMGLSLDEPVIFYIIVAVLIGLFLLILSRLLAGHFGRALNSINDSERRMRLLGYETHYYQLAAFILSGAITALAGALAANLFTYVGPSTLNWLVSGELLMMVILGGQGTLLGPLLGAFIIVLAETELATLTDQWQAILGVISLGSVLLTQQGIYPWLRSLGTQDD